MEKELPKNFRNVLNLYNNWNNTEYLTKYYLTLATYFPVY